MDKKLTLTCVRILLSVLIMFALFISYGASNIANADSSISDVSSADSDDASNESEGSVVMHTVKYSLIGVSAKAHEKAADSKDYEVEFIALDGYKLPTEVIVSIAGNVVDASKYNLNTKTGKLIIPSELVVDEISITATGTMIEVKQELIGNSILNVMVYVGMVLCVVVGTSAIVLLATDKKLKGRQ